MAKANKSRTILYIIIGIILLILGIVFFLQYRKKTAPIADETPEPGVSIPAATTPIIPPNSSNTELGNTTPTPAGPVINQTLGMPATKPNLKNIRF